MSFSADDFQDWLRQLDLHPEWQAELRRRVLTEELLELPAVVRQIAEQLSVLTAVVDALTARIGDLTVRLDTLTARVDALTVAVIELTAEVKVHGVDLGILKGEMLEVRYRDRAPAYFSRVARRLHVLDTGALAERLDDAVDAGTLEQRERDTILLADLVLTGRRYEDQADIYVLAEISFGIGPHAVERAADRSALLTKLGRPVFAVVAGQGITPEATALAEERGVWAVLEGRVVSSPPAT